MTSRWPSVGDCRRRAQARQKIGVPVPMNIAVVDAGANLKVFCGGWTVRGSGRSTSRSRRRRPRGSSTCRPATSGSCHSRQAAVPIEHSNGGLITFPGGIPLKNKKGEIVGGIGVSGGAVEQDHDVASAGANVL